MEQTNKTMNFLKHKELLRHLLAQGDQLNTLQGGRAMTDIKIEEQEQGILVRIFTPGVDADRYQIVSKLNKLIIELQALPSEKLPAGIPAIPLWARMLDMPATVDLDRIDAAVSGQELHIWLPFREDVSPEPRVINIRHV